MCHQYAVIGRKGAATLTQFFVDSKMGQRYGLAVRPPAIRIAGDCALGCAARPPPVQRMAVPGGEEEQ
jgi:hypothetical protein